MKKRLTNEQAVAVKKMIMENTDRYGKCTKSDKELAKLLAITPYSVLFYRRKVGVEAMRKLNGNGRNRKEELVQKHTHQDLIERLEVLEAAIFNKVANGEV